MHGNLACHVGHGMMLFVPIADAAFFTPPTNNALQADCLGTIME